MCERSYFRRFFGEVASFLHLHVAVSRVVAAYFFVMPVLTQSIRSAFPIFSGENFSLLYWDNAATTQVPAVVLEAIASFYTCSNANIHRGSYRLARKAEQGVGEVREQVRQFLGARSEQEIIFTQGATAGLNLVANSYGRQHVGQGDEVVISVMEHHSSSLPWEQLCQEQGARLRVAPLGSDGRLDMEQMVALVGPRTRVVVLTHVSNVLGVENPVAAVCKLAHTHQAVVVVDSAQAVGHLPIDVQALGCDFLVCSGHKMYGPTGVGVLYGRQALLESMPPFQVGGGTLATGDPRDGFAQLPHRLEAGTLPLASIMGLGAAIHFLQEIGWEALQAHESELTKKLYEQLVALPHVQLLGSGTPASVPIASFTVDGMHPLDVGLRLDAVAVATRTGFFCAKRLLEALGASREGAVRLSGGVYNDTQEVDQIVAVLQQFLPEKKWH